LTLAVATAGFGAGCADGFGGSSLTLAEAVAAGAALVKGVPK
jgi:hypothetical protein